MMYYYDAMRRLYVYEFEDGKVIELTYLENLQIARVFKEKETKLVVD